MMISRILRLFLLALFFLFSCEKSTEPVTSLENEMALQKNAINIATLLLDFETYEFEGGNLRTFALDQASDSDSLPFMVSFVYPADFGSVLFQLDQSADTVFYGTIVWRGEGEIFIPRHIVPADSFNISSGIFKEPMSIYHYEYISLPLLDSLAHDSTFNIKEKADSAWYAIKNLGITREFSKVDYRVGIYLYPPSVGAFIPSRAKWIVFLYARIKE